MRKMKNKIIIRVCLIDVKKLEEWDVWKLNLILKLHMEASNNLIQMAWILKLLPNFHQLELIQLYLQANISMKLSC